MSQTAVDGSPGLTTKSRRRRLVWPLRNVVWPLRIPFPRIYIAEGVTAEQFRKAQRAAAGHFDSDKVKKLAVCRDLLEYTESDPRRDLLYSHARGGQIRDEDLRRLPDSELAFLAGITPSPDLDELERHDERSKLQGNVARAANVLSWRGAYRSAVAGIGVAALVVALVAKLI